MELSNRQIEEIRKAQIKRLMDNGHTEKEALEWWPKNKADCIMHWESFIEDGLIDKEMFLGLGLQEKRLGLTSKRRGRPKKKPNGNGKQKEVSDSTNEVVSLMKGKLEKKLKEAYFLYVCLKQMREFIEFDLPLIEELLPDDKEV